MPLPDPPLKDQPLKDRIALITGTGSGIGRATALLLAKQGAKILSIDRTSESAEATAEMIRQSGGEAIVSIADISHADSMQQTIQAIGEKYGQIDIVFANAGVNGVWASLEDLTPEEWDDTLNTNLKGTFLTVKYAVPYLKQHGGSVIINSSVNGTRMFSNTGATAYACSKAAQVAFSKMVALELAKYRIRVNVICPGAIATDISESTQKRALDQITEPVEYPEGRIPLTDGQAGTAEQVAQLVLFLSSDAASHISGTEVWIDGAESLLQG